MDTEAVRELHSCSLVSSIDEGSHSGMADRGMGIRLFNTKEALQQIFEEFELSDSEDEDGSNSGDEDAVTSRTAVVTSQLRHFVIQVEMKSFWSTFISSFQPSYFRNTYYHRCFLIHAKYHFMAGLVPQIFSSRDTKSACSALLFVVGASS